MSGLGTRHSFLVQVTAILPIHLVTYMLLPGGASGAPERGVVQHHEPQFLSEGGASFTYSQGSVKVGDRAPKGLCLVPGR